MIAPVSSSVRKLHKLLGADVCEELVQFSRCYTFPAMNRVLVRVWPVGLAVVMAVLPFLGPVIDHHFAERQPYHAHFGTDAGHEHYYASLHAHQSLPWTGSGVEQAAENLPPTGSGGRNRAVQLRGLLSRPVRGDADRLRARGAADARP